MKKIIFIILAIVALATPALAANIKPAVGYQAPDGIVYDMQSNKVTLSTIIAANKVTLVHFWTTWCPYCQIEDPYLTKLYMKYHSAGLEIVAVSFNESVGTVKAWILNKKPAYPIYTEPQASLYNRYQVITIPVTFVVDQKGIIIAKLNHNSTYQTFVDAVVPLLEAK